MSEQAIPLAGVIGSPVHNSRAPALFRYWMRQQGMQGYYVPMEVSQQDLRQAVRAAPRMGFVGLNVAAPHKESMLDIADSVSDRAAIIGAANTLVFRPDGSVYADNTEGAGFLDSLRVNAPHWQANLGPAAVFGAGAAARAVVGALVEAGAPEIRIANRTRARSEALRHDFGGRIVVYDWVQAGNIVDGAATVINATSLGMAGRSEFRVPLDGLSPWAVVTDLVFSPVQTTFLQRAADMGCSVVDGLGMLIWQAVPNFQRFFGELPEVDEGARRAAMGA